MTALVEAEYDDASTASHPVIIDYGRGATAAAESRSASLTAAKRTLTVPMLGVAAFRADKDRARAFWDDLTKDDADGAPDALTDGAVRVDLDGRVEAALEHSVPQIHAPEAWAAGFDGTGTTVAVLDTGYDPTHPDLAGKVSESSNFTSDAGVADGNGHGTHVASTIAGTGAASDRLRRGVAPGADLIVGKVLTDGGWGADSWVLAGMQWAVQQHADVVSMSLGGDADDGTHPLAKALDELSASSGTLFVVAAGNAGPSPSTVSSPGSADAALTVGAVDGNDAMAGFSSRGPRILNGGLKPEVSAPGVDITAPAPQGPTSDPRWTSTTPPSAGRPWRRRTSPGSPPCSSSSTRRGTVSASSRRSPTAPFPSPTRRPSTPARAASTRSAPSRQTSWPLPRCTSARSPGPTPRRSRPARRCATPTRPTPTSRSTWPWPARTAPRSAPAPWP